MFCNNYAFKIWRVKDDSDTQAECVKTLNPESGWITDLKMGRDVLVSCSYLIHLWALESYKCVRKLVPNQGAIPRCIQVLPGDRLISGLSSKAFQMWCLRSGESLHVYRDHPSEPNAIQIYFHV